VARSLYIAAGGPAASPCGQAGGEFYRRLAHDSTIAARCDRRPWRAACPTGHCGSWPGCV